MKIKWHKPSWPEVKFWFEDTQIIRARFYVFGWAALLAVLLIGAKLGAQTAPVEVTTTKSNTLMPIGNGTNAVELNRVRYNPDKHVMTILISGKSNDEVVMTGQEISVSGNLVSGSAKVETVPTFDNHWTVLVSNLPKTYGAVQLKIKSAEPLNNVNGTQVKTKANIAKISVKQQDAPVDRSLVQMTPKQVAIDAVNGQINKTSKQISKLSDQAKSIRQNIKYYQSQINKATKDTAIMTESERRKIDDSVDKWNNEITNLQTQVTTISHKMVKRTDTLTELKDKLSAVESGKYKFPVSKTTGVLKQAPKKDK